MSVPRPAQPPHQPMTAPPGVTHFQAPFPPAYNRSHSGSSGSPLTSARDRLPPTTSNGDRPPSDQSDPGSKKAGRKPSRPPVTSYPSHSDPNSPQASSSQSNRPRASSSAQAQPASDSPPAVLVREKKQKACANCRKAKLKCIIDETSSECVRCKARKEKCIFYPRSHDEDWQQTVTTDVYSAISHVSQMSRAVHHILHHLTRERIIPPLAEPFEVYQPVERDLAVLQGWSAERNNVLPNKAKPGDKRKREDEELPHKALSSNDLPDTGRPVVRQIDQSYRDEPALDDGFRPPDTAALASASYRGSVLDNNFRPCDTATRFPIPMLGHERARPTDYAAMNELAPFQPQPPTPVQLAPTSEIQVTTFDQQLPLGPPLPVWSRDDLPNHVQLPLPSTMPPPISSPKQQMQQATPNSMPRSSPASLPPKTPGEWAMMQTSSVRSDPAVLPPLESSTSLEEALNNIPTTQTSQHMEVAILVDEDGEEVYGSADGRKTVISKGLIPPREAKYLVSYFHANVSPFLFGYNLQLREFPYLADGPRSITPFILATECLLASERVAELFTYHAALADEVLMMLTESPAESWQTFESSKNKDLVSGDDTGDKGDKNSIRLGQAWETDDASWDAELGIGPEEIVAICALATFISQREEARNIAQHAFSWAKGWAKYVENPSATFAETTNIVTPLRTPTLVERARIWLLAYVVLGQELVQANAYGAGIADPSEWCKIVLPDLDLPSSTSPATPHDILLVGHARLLVIMFKWSRDRLNIPQQPDGDTNITAMRRITERTNQHLDWWAEDLRAYGLSQEWTKQILLDWLYSKIVVSSALYKSMWRVRPEDVRMRDLSRALAVDSAVQLLRRCLMWPPDMISQLPNVYYRMIALAAGEVVEALIEIAHGKLSPSVAVVPPEEIIGILAPLSGRLSAGGMQEGHYCRQTSMTLRHYVNQLSQLRTR